MTGYRTSNNFFPNRAAVAVLLAAGLLLSACKGKEGGDTGPMQMPVVQAGDMSLVSVDKPDQFPLVAAEAYDAPSELDVTG